MSRTEKKTRRIATILGLTAVLAATPLYAQRTVAGQEQFDLGSVLDQERFIGKDYRMMTRELRGQRAGPYLTYEVADSASGTLVGYVQLYLTGESWNYAVANADIPGAGGTHADERITTITRLCTSPQSGQKPLRNVRELLPTAQQETFPERIFADTVPSVIVRVLGSKDSKSGLYSTGMDRTIAYFINTNGIVERIEQAQTEPASEVGVLNSFRRCE